MALHAYPFCGIGPAGEGIYGLGLDIVRISFLFSIEFCGKPYLLVRRFSRCASEICPEGMRHAQDGVKYINNSYSKFVARGREVHDSDRS